MVLRETGEDGIVAADQSSGLAFALMSNDLLAPDSGRSGRTKTFPCRQPVDRRLSVDGRSDVTAQTTHKRRHGVRVPLDERLVQTLELCL
jgi:hypothetical protein